MPQARQDGLANQEALAVVMGRFWRLAVGVVLVAVPRAGEAEEVLGGVLPAGAAAEILRVHNAERAAVGVAPLRWDQELASTALACAERLASRGAFHHCGQGENLWLGSTGRFSPTAMVELWASERRAFQPGLFPEVSRSGRWEDVGHYTQMVWRQTTAVGCGAAAGADGRTRLVCHYAPAGNRIGQPVY
ncbi:MAG: CAP domain-containing protein [Cyanobacteriota bacterium]|nr:CAP domain-containing protein [Cyanobacteriota bacterium]